MITNPPTNNVNVNVNVGSKKSAAHKNGLEVLVITPLHLTKKKNKPSFHTWYAWVSPGSPTIKNVLKRF